MARSGKATEQTEGSNRRRLEARVRKRRGHLVEAVAVRAEVTHDILAAGHVAQRNRRNQHLRAKRRGERIPRTQAQHARQTR